MTNTSTSQNKRMFQGKVWLDCEGNPLNAHGAGFLKVDDTFYMYGEFKKGDTFCTEHIKDWDAFYVDAIGFACYSSKNLHEWKYEGIVFHAEFGNPSHPMHPTRIMERPKVVYNESTKQYVMWFHSDDREYQTANVGIAVSDSPTGPFKFLRVFRPNGNESRDMTVFKDDDGKAFLFYSSENNDTTRICELTDDYLDCKPKESRIFIGKRREAPSVFKYNGSYYIITSGCTGWDPNPGELSWADTPLGPWKVIGDPFVGPNSLTTFDSQCGYVIPVQPEDGIFVMAADRWLKTDLENSTYVWIPFKADGENTKIYWKDFFESPISNC